MECDTTARKQGLARLPGTDDVIDRAAVLLWRGAKDESLYVATWCWRPELCADNRFGIAVGDDTPMFQHDRPLGQTAGFGRVVSNQQGGCRVRLLHGQQGILEFGAHAIVECRQGFVQ